MSKDNQQALDPYAQKTLEEVLALFEAYKDEHGHLPKSVSATRWLARTRSRALKGALSEEQCALLRNAGILEDRVSQRFETRLAECVAFKAEHGHWPTKAESVPLASWLTQVRMRARCGDLSDEFLEAAKTAGVLANLPNDHLSVAFANHVDACVAHKARFGHLPTNEDLPREAEWLRYIRIRSQKGELSDEQREILEKADIL